MSDKSDPPERETLVRLANSCDRAASTNAATGTRMSDLDAEDFKTIARVLRSLAEQKG